MLLEPQVPKCSMSSMFHQEKRHNKPPKQHMVSPHLRVHGGDTHDVHVPPGRFASGEGDRGRWNKWPAWKVESFSLLFRVRNEKLKPGDLADIRFAMCCTPAWKGVVSPIKRRVLGESLHLLADLGLETCMEHDISCTRIHS